MTDNVTDEVHERNLKATPRDGVKCEIDGVWVHSIPTYLKRVHPDVSQEDYLQQFPGAKLLSPRLEAQMASKKAGTLIAAHTATAELIAFPAASVKKPFKDVFGLGDVKAALNKRGDPIMVDVLNVSSELAGFVPDVDENYIFPIDNLKAVMMATQLNMPFYAWGMHGAGKTTLIEQFLARTGHPTLRVQHTVNTEEAHILGQYVLKDGEKGSVTEFMPGPLPFAMRNGLAYIADEYDFALPSVTSAYQPVLEGKALVIKDAPPEWRIVKPHPNFRIYGTGNTNGGGDETGLYQGTQMQNAANYSRWGITVEVEYMPEAQETGVVASQGKIHPDHARALVRFAQQVRETYARGEISSTVSPRELIRAAQLGRALGGEWKQGLMLAYGNRLSRLDKEVVGEVLQRIFAT